MKRNVHKSRPSREPQHVSETVWFYEDRASLIFVVEHHAANGNHLATTQFRVLSSRLIKSLRRMGKA